jgi:hypothetical protein
MFYKPGQLVAPKRDQEQSGTAVGSQQALDSDGIECIGIEADGQDVGLNAEKKEVHGSPLRTQHAMFAFVYL